MEGTQHFLTIRDAILDDDAKYTVRIETVECSALLTVEGDCKQCRGAHFMGAGQ